MRVTTLIEDENHDVLGLEAEKGLSLYIQRDDDSILFDTGATGIFVENAEKLGVDLKDVDVTAISHGHFDHRGGLRSFLK
jgi:7,8-dihydropterin-6-yl-methyl-4-(beta-D-ribofuranosyl)aminobenzene 5'-phosphate synthase